MNPQLKDEIINMAIQIIHSHTESGEPLSKNEASIVMLAAKLKEPKDTGLNFILSKIPELSKYAPLLMSFITKGGV